MEYVKQTINLEKIRFTISLSTFAFVIGATAYFVQWKTEVDIAMRKDTVSTTAFASMQTDISYMKDDMKFIKTTLQQLVEKKD